jgi:acyl carrier protein
MTRDEISGALTAIFRETFADPAMLLRPELTAADVPGWDSLKMVMIFMAVEERFGIRLRTREMDALACVGDFLDLIERKTGAA